MANVPAHSGRMRSSSRLCWSGAWRCPVVGTRMGISLLSRTRHHWALRRSLRRLRGGPRRELGRDDIGRSGLTSLNSPPPMAWTTVSELDLARQGQVSGTRTVSRPSGSRSVRRDGDVAGGQVRSAGVEQPGDRIADRAVGGHRFAHDLTSQPSPGTLPPIREGPVGIADVEDLRESPLDPPDDLEAQRVRRLSSRDPPAPCAEDSDPLREPQRPEDAEQVPNDHGLRLGRC